MNSAKILLIFDGFGFLFNLLIQYFEALKKTTLML